MQSENSWEKRKEKENTFDKLYQNIHKNEEQKAPIRLYSKQISPTTIIVKSRLEYHWSDLLVEPVYGIYLWQSKSDEASEMLLWFLWVIARFRDAAKYEIALHPSLPPFPNTLSLTWNCVCLEIRQSFLECWRACWILAKSKWKSNLDLRKWCAYGSFVSHLRRRR